MGETAQCMDATPGRELRKVLAIDDEDNLDTTFAYFSSLIETSARYGPGGLLIDTLPDPLGVPDKRTDVHAGHCIRSTPTPQQPHVWHKLSSGASKFQSTQVPLQITAWGTHSHSTAWQLLATMDEGVEQAGNKGLCMQQCFSSPHEQTLQRTTQTIQVLSNQCADCSVHALWLPTQMGATGSGTDAGKIILLALEESAGMT